MTTLRKVGGSVMLAVPPALLDVLHMEAGASVGLAVRDGQLVVDPRRKPRYALAALLAEADGARSDEDQAWLDMPSVGRELP